MDHIEKSIEVETPIRTAYNQWTQFEEFPHFMEGVKEVRQITSKTLNWRAQVGGKEVEWTAEITEQEPDRKVSWRSTSGTANSGTVFFSPLSSNKTKVTLHLYYDPEGFLENVGSATGMLSARVEGDLKRFKKFIESRGEETGSWRGEIQGAKVVRDDEETLGEAHSA